MPSMRASVVAEFSSVDLGDQRRNARCVFMAKQLSKRPGQSLPAVFQEPKAIEGTYRFFANDAVEPEAILAPHIACTVQRARSCSTPLLVIHDTTEMKFPGDFPREGCGKLRHDRQGFDSHVSIVATYEPSADAKDVLGVLRAQPYFTPRTEKEHKPKKKMPALSTPGSRRWLDAIEASEVLIPDRVLIHVGDRGAESYALLAHLQKKQRQFVLRVSYDRAVLTTEGTQDSLFDEARTSHEFVTTRSVRVSSRHRAELPDAKSSAGKPALKKGKIRRADVNKKRHPPRLERQAELHITAGTHTLIRPATEGKDLPDTLEISVVRVFEPRPPAGVEPVEWLLYTSNPLETRADVEQVVDVYRNRWLIEEFFKALKTGCGYERLQLENKNSILNALAIMMPIAWCLLRLRTLARLYPECPLRAVLTARQIAILRILRKRKLPPNPTVRDGLDAIAGLGGHLKHNGPPGWQTLGRGFERLLEAECLAKLFKGKKM
jgi:hypothetical protein